MDKVNLDEVVGEETQDVEAQKGALRENPSREKALP